MKPEKKEVFIISLLLTFMDTHLLARVLNDLRSVPKYFYRAASLNRDWLRASRDMARPAYLVSELTSDAWFGKSPVAWSPCGRFVAASVKRFVPSSKVEVTVWRSDTGGGHSSPSHGRCERRRPNNATPCVLYGLDGGARDHHCDGRVGPDFGKLRPLSHDPVGCTCELNVVSCAVSFDGTLMFSLKSFMDQSVRCAELHVWSVERTEERLVVGPGGMALCDIQVAHGSNRVLAKSNGEAVWMLDFGGMPDAIGIRVLRDARLRAASAFAWSRDDALIAVAAGAAITAVFKIKWDTNAHCKILMF